MLDKPQHYTVKKILMMLVSKIIISSSQGGYSILDMNSSSFYGVFQQFPGVFDKSISKLIIIDPGHN